MGSVDRMCFAQVAVERAAVSDAPAITAMFISARRGMAYLPHELHSEEQTRDWLTGLLGGGEARVLKVTADGEVAGFCVLCDCWIDHLYVDPRFQGMGIGSRLLEVAIGSAPRLQLWVFQRNTGAIRLYERHGFRLAERTDGSRNEECEPDARYVRDGDRCG